MRVRRLVTSRQYVCLTYMNTVLWLNLDLMTGYLSDLGRRQAIHMDVHLLHLLLHLGQREGKLSGGFWSVFLCPKAPSRNMQNYYELLQISWKSMNIWVYLKFVSLFNFSLLVSRISLLWRLPQFCRRAPTAQWAGCTNHHCVYPWYIQLKHRNCWLMKRKKQK